MKESLDFIYKEQKEISTFGGVAALLGWDQMTYMPPGGAQERSNQIALISKLVHEKVISDNFWNHIEKLSGNIQDLSEDDKVVVQRLKKDVEKSRKVPSDYVERAAKATTLSYPAWQEAREKADFSIFAPHLEKIVELKKEYCEYINLPGPAYNNLLDEYEEGMTVDKLKQEFSYLRSKLIEILEKVKTSNIYQNQQASAVKLDADKQKELSRLVIEKMQLPNERMRIDVSTHPFTISMGNDDVRFTTNYERENPLFSFFATIHEAGHALYELGMPVGKFKDTVISDSPSLGLHESQSRFWENMIGKSRYFWDFFFPYLKQILPSDLRNLDSWIVHVNRVKPSFIRVEADELTYCLHVILRFELENMLMEDEIKVTDLPSLWNEKMNEMLGITPPSDREGVLQDMHWSGGNFGYFPTYAIGSIYASQLFNKLSNENSNVYSEIQNGRFKNILSWLDSNIFRYGRSMTADEIIKNACGEGLNSKIFVKYLKDKYFELYQI